MHRTLLLPLLMTATGLLGQYAPPDPSGLEGILVERYYVADANDASDSDGSSDLDEGEITYRVFADLKAGYKLITVGGFPGHDISFNTTTTFFYNDDRGEAWAVDINDIHLNKNSVAIDSWLTVGAASDAHWGVPKDEDPDGSILTSNDGGSTGTPMLVNTDPLAGIPLTQADGLIPGTPPGILSVGSAPTIFNDLNGSSYSSDNFAWSSNIGNIEGPTASNRILLGQFTTDGTLTFCLNLWVRIPDSLVCNDPNCHEILEYYATIIPADTLGGGYNADNKFSTPWLCFDSSSQQVDCAGVPGGSALPGTPCDDGNGDTANDVYDANCVCVGEDCEGVLGGPALPGQPCDDGDPNTVNDTWQTGCICSGTVGIGEQGADDLIIDLHPNPVLERFTVSITGAGGSRIRIELKNTLGQRVVARDLGVVPGTWSGILDLSERSSGIYFLEVVHGDARTVRRVVKR
ncbi:MAG TPA: T9SS type A sorting domain-containing protein [Flavobacteriales bacterium]|nr:T9SS type A sorting domain-containing protein [Flavobacteriales bacterium]HMR26228.1 T9SS type A sorting domain-containing protein [Flavobacteriales bacterium]